MYHQHFNFYVKKITEYLSNIHISSSHSYSSSVTFVKQHDNMQYNSLLLARNKAFLFFFFYTEDIYPFETRKCYLYSHYLHDRDILIWRIGTLKRITKKSEELGEPVLSLFQHAVKNRIWGARQDERKKIHGARSHSTDPVQRLKSGRRYLSDRALRVAGRLR